VSYSGDRAPPEPIGVVLAGGAGRRLGGPGAGGKAEVELGGRPLISYPLAALAAALGQVAVLAKPDTRLPQLPGVTVWREPEEPRHPALGIWHALRLAAGRPVLVCPLDMPLLSAELIAQLAAAQPGSAPAVIAAHDGEIQPLLGCYQPRAREQLALERARAGAPLRELVHALGPRLLEVGDPDLLLNVNRPQDLRRAESLLARRAGRASRT